MKKPIYLALAFLFGLILYSCSSSDEPMEVNNESEEENQEQTEEIQDDYSLLTLNDIGELHSIGNNSGRINLLGLITREENAQPLSPGSFVSINNKVYAMEGLVNAPGPRNNLLMYDRASNTSEIIRLSIPNSIPGPDRIIGPIVANGNNLLGILYETNAFVNAPKHLISINLETYEVTDLSVLNINDDYTSLLKIGNKLIVSTWGEGSVLIDLDDLSQETFEVDNTSINGSRFALVNDINIAFMESVAGFAGGGKPKLLDLNSQTITDNSREDEVYALISGRGNTVFHGGEYLNLVSQFGTDLYFGILKSNFNSGENTLVEIDSQTISRNTTIIDIIE